MADIDKLMEFLQKEVPSNAGDLNDAINNTLEIIERTRAAVTGRMNKLAQTGKHKDAREFLDVDEHLSNIENYLQEFVGTTNAKDLNKQFSKEIISNQSTENKPNYNSYKVDETEPHNLDEDFKNKRPVGFSLEGKRYSVRNWNRLLVMVCEILNRQNSNLFQSFPDDESMQGRTRTYFSREQMKYACKKVGGTDIYVLTNTRNRK